MIDGDNAIKYLYDAVVGENGTERVLKPMFHGQLTTSAFIVEIDITMEMLSKYSFEKI